MSFNLISSSLVLNAGAAFSPLLPAGNYYLDAISIGVSTLTGVAAGNMAGTVFLTNGSFANIYAASQIAGVAPAAPFLLVTNFVLNLTPGLMCKRGDALTINLFNNLNAAQCVAVINLYGSNLP